MTGKAASLTGVFSFGVLSRVRVQMLWMTAIDSLGCTNQYFNVSRNGEIGGKKNQEVGKTRIATSVANEDNNIVLPVMIDLPRNFHETLKLRPQVYESRVFWDMLFFVCAVNVRSARRTEVVAGLCHGFRAQQRSIALSPDWYTM